MILRSLGIVCLLVSMALAQAGKVYTPAPPGFAGKSGLQTLVITKNSYTIPTVCTGQAMLDIMGKLWPHLAVGSIDDAISTAVAVPTAEQLRSLAQALDYRDFLLKQYKTILDACEKGE